MNHFKNWYLYFVFLEIRIATEGPFVSVTGTFCRRCQTSV